ncbi:ABC transporter permease [Gottschalkiaceae bacterium SANA]|nr:ABC transporter permease [Gottschalkiaceae bacterium SANA]
MGKYIFRRLLYLIPVVFGVSVLVFTVMHLFTSDPALTILGQHATDADAAALREELGFNLPLVQQYWNFLSGMLQGNFGTSLFTHTPVFNEVMSRFPATIELALFAIIVASVVGVTLGVISAVKQNSIFDYASMTISLMGVSMPIFWLGLIMIVVFSLKLGWFPVSGRIQMGYDPAHVTGLYILDSILTGNTAAFKSAVEHIILPGTALAMYSMAIIARMTRSTMLETLGQDYIRTARAKGIVERLVIVRHALRNAMIPIVTVIGLQMGGLLGGAVLTETVFSWPGVGSYTVESILKSDYPVVQGTVMMMSIIFVLVNLAVDLIYSVLDPRIKYS